jgi:hypothetical protein
VSASKYFSPTAISLSSNEPVPYRSLKLSSFEPVPVKSVLGFRAYEVLGGCPSTEVLLAMESENCVVRIECV